MGTTTKTKEDPAKLKALRQELEGKILESLPESGGREIRVQIEKLDEALAVDESIAKQIVESLLFSATKPMTMSEIRKVLKGYSPSKVEKLLKALKGEYETENRSFRLNEIAGGYEIATLPKFAPWIMKNELQKKARQATQSALETLAILAYKQPVTRAEVEDIRGVNCSGLLSTLLDKEFIKIAGRKEVPGRPILYGTTEKFLEHFGLKSLQELPSISDIQELVEQAVQKDELIQPKEVIVSEEETVEEREA